MNPFRSVLRSSVTLFALPLCVALAAAAYSPHAMAGASKGDTDCCEGHVNGTINGEPVSFSFNWGVGETVKGSGTVASERRVVSDYQAISARGSIKVVVRQTGREGVELRGDDNLLPMIQTRVEDGRRGRTLVIEPKKNTSFNPRTEIVATVDVINLSAVASSGSGDVDIGALKTPSLSVSLSGSADARLNAVQADDLDISISGSGDVIGSGSAQRLKLSIAGSGDVKTPALQAADVNVSIAGSGDAEVSASKSISVSIAGSGDVVYHGDAQVLKSSVAGSGSVTHR